MHRTAEVGSTCPSGRCREGTLLIGVMGDDGRVRYLGQPFPVDSGFVDAAAAGVPAETRFRFAEPCASRDCGHWTGSECGLVDILLKADVELSETNRRLPRCGIRRSCVWFAQRGPAACRLCPLVVHTLPTPPVRVEDSIAGTPNDGSFRTPRASAKSGGAEQGERVVEAVAHHPVQTSGDVRVASSAEHDGGEVA